MSLTYMSNSLTYLLNSTKDLKTFISRFDYYNPVVIHNGNSKETLIIKNKFTLDEIKNITNKEVLYFYANEGKVDTFVGVLFKCFIYHLILTEESYAKLSLIELTSDSSGELMFCKNIVEESDFYNESNK